jgi:hypothetical protein
MGHPRLFTGENGVSRAEAGGLGAAEKDVDFASDVVDDGRWIPHGAASPTHFPSLDDGPLAGFGVGQARFCFVAAGEGVGVKHCAERLKRFTVIDAPPHHQVVCAKVSARPDATLGKG